jgi:hypothetical protein
MQVLDVLTQALGNLTAVMGESARYEPVRVMVKRRGDGDWIAVLSVYDPDDESGRVAFGVGFDWVGAVVALNAAVAGDNFKVEKPYNNGGPLLGQAAGAGSQTGKGNVEKHSPPQGVIAVQMEG